MRNYDLCVLGAGPGGYAAAIAAAKADLKTALIEEDRVGGTCLNVGCIPSKAYLAVSETVSLIKKAREYGLEVRLGRIDFSKVKAFQEKVVRDLRAQLEKSIASSGAETLRGRGELLSRNSVRIQSQKAAEEICAQTLIIATGSRPKPLPLLPFDGERILSSTDALALQELPKSLVIVGAGATGCEFASFFSGMGTHVTLVEVLEQVLPTEDVDVSKRLEVAFKKRALSVLLGARIEKVRKGKKSVRLELHQGPVEAEKVLVTTGRKRNTENLGLEKVGIRLEGDGVWTDENFETSVKGIYAIGDVVAGRAQLAHLAQAEAHLVVSHLIGEAERIDLTACPNCIFTDPEVASVGWTKRKAEEAGISCEEVRLPLGGLGKAQIALETEGFVKIVFEKDFGRVLGAHLFGTGATELISELALAVQMKISVRELAQVIHPHPTFSEGIHEALRLALSKQQRGRIPPLKKGDTGGFSERAKSPLPPFAKGG